MNDKVIENLEKLKEVYIAKNTDYGNSFTLSIIEFGAMAGLVRIFDKYNRAKNLLQNHEAKVKDETVIDTLLDMGLYCIMLAAELNKDEK
ncbi:MAG: nucleotide modification associated domain-containing protein [Candidatus Nanoarchaeia archaeon]|nr:nucleotide modification associated domain-containing protein [Candidatus Nanoarchaeia archaeon]